jgi:hypothetical protein
MYTTILALGNEASSKEASELFARLIGEMMACFTKRAAE